MSAFRAATIEFGTTIGTFRAETTELHLNEASALNMVAGSERGLTPVNLWYHSGR